MDAAAAAEPSASPAAYSAHQKRDCCRRALRATVPAVPAAAAAAPAAAADATDDADAAACSIDRAAGVAPPRPFVVRGWCEWAEAAAAVRRAWIRFRA
eukprot:356917-Chlamydomonas_euryale.AAC.17